MFSIRCFYVLQKRHEHSVNILMKFKKKSYTKIEAIKKSGEKSAGSGRARTKASEKANNIIRHDRNESC